LITLFAGDLKNYRDDLTDPTNRKPGEGIDGLSNGISDDAEKVDVNTERRNVFGKIDVDEKRRNFDLRTFRSSRCRGTASSPTQNQAGHSGPSQVPSPDIRLLSAIVYRVRKVNTFNFDFPNSNFKLNIY
jgi:hypothetical protein